MVVVHNLSAMNAQRMFGVNSKKKAGSTEKLSSGYRINRAADDAAGLSISEKLRRQIRGLDQAAENCQEGVNMVQVADGALAEVQEMLHRMTELSVKAVNGTLQLEDREFIQEEVSHLVSEISRIGKNTSYNDLYMFDKMRPDSAESISVTSLVKSPAADTGYLTEVYDDGTGGTNAFHPAANLDFSGINASNISFLYNKSFSFACSQACPEMFIFKMVDGDGTQDSVDGQNNGSNPHTYTIDIHGMTQGSEIVAKLYNYVKDNMPNSYTPLANGDLNVSHSNLIKMTDANTLTIYATIGYATEAQAAAKFANATGPYGGIDCSQVTNAIQRTGDNLVTIQAGCEAGDTIDIIFRRMNSQLLGIDVVDVSTVNGASSAISKVDSALKQISSQRATLGASQNRLEHAIDNLLNVSENTQAAESRIRDTDMAKEMVTYSNTSILEQVGHAMMAQANQSNQGVLNLLN